MSPDLPDITLRTADADASRLRDQAFAPRTPDIAVKGDPKGSLVDRIESYGGAIAQTVQSTGESAALYIGSTALLSKLPVVGRVAPYAVGATAGFFQPIKEDQGIETRLANAALGAGTIWMLGHGTKLVEKGTDHLATASGYSPSWYIKRYSDAHLNPREFPLPKIPPLPLRLANGEFGRLAVANAGVGAINTELSSLINDHKSASAADLATGAATWSAMGAAFHGGGRFWQYRQEATRIKVDNQRFERETAQKQDAERLEQQQREQAELEKLAARENRIDIHISEEQNPKWHNVDDVSDYPYSGKPNGLWTSPEHKWARMLPTMGIGPEPSYAFLVDSSKANVLKISKPSDVEALIKKYGIWKNGESMSDINFKEARGEHFDVYRDFATSGIDWPRVAAEYDGVKFTDVRRNLMQWPTWYNHLDCDSACFFNVDKLRITPLGEMPSLPHGDYDDHYEHYERLIDQLVEQAKRRASAS